MTTSRRTQPLPGNWSTIRRRILTRDHGQCTWIRSNGTRCTQPATDVDHIIDTHLGGPDTDDNLQSLCRWHHNHKTSKAARATQPPPQRRNRDPEPHPGLTE